MDLRKNCLQKATELESHLKTHRYLYVKDIIAHVKITYEFEYSIAGMRNWLHKHGFSYKKPPIVPGKANQLECLWKWMKERIIYNTYYEYFEDFKARDFWLFFYVINPRS